ncbi:c-type cytochrome biogenesis protein CcsB [Acaricomes phytoseiuli]|uniref:c-type cytochrome biogenesis protein CcsB n=1 Tax=Acaricomes phytoseiuli TaxID=291968 RepID=UPI00037FC50B|nr:c-type cytochrome biogenesis protein CcsB [Acaricomes phytoseiuli]MCW1250056.1 c-type cytochrome biogenesis protein CcsB [Acaricomes phytoseiuli]
MPEINPLLGEYSDLFMLLAALTYAVAFCAFTWDLVKSSRTTRAIESRALASSQQRQEEAVAAAAKKPQAKAAAAGAENGASSPNGTTVDLAERPTTSSAPKTSEMIADDSMRYGGERRPVARVAVALTILAVLLHGVGVLTRGLAAGRVPWGNMYEFCTTGGFLVVVVFLLTLIRRDLRFLGTFVIGLVLVMLFAAGSAFYVPVGHLVPSLQSYWLIIHVSIAVISSALFTLTFAMSILQLIQSRREIRLLKGEPDKLPFMRLAPSALSLENLSYRLNAVGFVGWTLTLIFGAIWAEKAWGRYWGWDTKEVWTFIIWVVYAGYLHSRATRGWTGTRAAWLSIVGYVCVVFNFTIVNIYFAGFHSYSGLN